MDSNLLEMLPKGLIEAIENRGYEPPFEQIEKFIKTNDLKERVKPKDDECVKEYQLPREENKEQWVDVLNKAPKRVNLPYKDGVIHSVVKNTGLPFKDCDGNIEYIRADIAKEEIMKDLMKGALEAVMTRLPDGTFNYSTKNLIDDDMEERGFCLFDYHNVKIVLVKEG